MNEEEKQNIDECEQEFHATIRYGNKTQVNKIPQTHESFRYLFIYYKCCIFAHFTGLSSNISGLFHKMLYSRIQLFL